MCIPLVAMLITHEWFGMKQADIIVFVLECLNPINSFLYNANQHFRADLSAKTDILAKTTEVSAKKKSVVGIHFRTAS